MGRSKSPRGNLKPSSTRDVRSGVSFRTSYIFFFSFVLRMTILFSGSNEKYEPFRNRIIPALATHMTICKRENLAKTTSCQWCVMLVMIRSFFACYTLFGDVITLSIRCQDGWASGPRHDETRLFVRLCACWLASQWW